MKALVDVESKDEWAVVVEARPQLIHVLAQSLILAQVVSLSIGIGSLRWLGIVIVDSVRPVFFFADSFTIESLHGVPNGSSGIFLCGVLVVSGVVVEEEAR